MLDWRSERPLLQSSCAPPAEVQRSRSQIATFEKEVSRAETRLAQREREIGSLVNKVTGKGCENSLDGTAAREHSCCMLGYRSLDNDGYSC